MNMKDIREIMGLTQAQVADELGVPRQEVIDCEENGETYLLLQYISAFPINPQVLKDEDVDPFLPSFDQTTPGHRMQAWREKYGISAGEMAAAAGMTEEELAQFEAGEGAPMSRRRGEMIEKKTGINRKWLMYGDGRAMGEPTMTREKKTAEEKKTRDGKSTAPNRPAGQRIRQARTDAGLTREEVADMLNLSVSRVIQMESGYVKDPRAEHVISRIAAHSAVPVKEDPRAAGQRLRDARKAAGLSVKEAAEIIRLKYTTLAHLESGYISSAHADELIEKIRNAPAKGAKAPFDPKEAGVRIREERVRAGLSQKELATILRVPVNRVSLMELGNVTEKETETILRRIAGKPAREIMNHKVKPTEQVLLGSNIRDARNAARLSQKELGDLLQLPQTKISLIERGKVDEPTGRRILQMLNAMVENKSSDMEMARQDVVPLGRERHRSMRAPDPELGKAVHDARVAAGLSQKELARIMGMSQGSISYMEQGKTDQEQANRALALIAQAAGTANPAESAEKPEM